MQFRNKFDKVPKKFIPRFNNFRHLSAGRFLLLRKYRIAQILAAVHNEVWKAPIMALYVCGVVIAEVASLYIILTSWKIYIIARILHFRNVRKQHLFRDSLLLQTCFETCFELVSRVAKYSETEER